MEFIVVSRDEINQGIVVRTPYVVISITDPGSRGPKIPKSAGFRGALCLQFHDAVPDKSLALPADLVLMTKENARQIWDFVLGHQDKIGTVVVHCEQGMSRSPAIAAALCDRLGTDSQRFLLEFHPNEYIYELMVSCFPDGSHSH